jgi:hypothetical protein
MIRPQDRLPDVGTIEQDHGFIVAASSHMMISPTAPEPANENLK